MAQLLAWGLRNWSLLFCGVVIVGGFTLLQILNARDRAEHEATSRSGAAAMQAIMTQTAATVH